jgi:hypothetical protein
MTLPTFLGIGAMRSGSTWLYGLLKSHPDIYVPMHRKEINFFNENYNYGVEWYERYFPSSKDSFRYKAIGEISPRYLHHIGCPERISGISSVSKILLILRNPVDRAYSEYGLLVRDHNLKVSFEQAVASHKSILENGFYSNSIKRYLKYFSQDQMLILIFEQAVANPDKTMKSLARFFAVDSEKFTQSHGEGGVNNSYIPRFQSVYSYLVNMAVSLYKYDLEWVVSFSKKLGVKKLFGKGSEMPPMENSTRIMLEEMYKDEIAELEALFSIDLQCWKK